MSDGLAPTARAGSTPPSVATIPFDRDPRTRLALRRAVAGLDDLLTAFHASTGCHASLWLRDGAAVDLGSASARPAPTLSAVGLFGDGAWRDAAVDGGTVLIGGVPGVGDCALVVGPLDATHARGQPTGGALPCTVLRAHAAWLAPAVAHHLQSALEVEQSARELSERYEEINLLYTISEILGRAVTLEETMATIVGEVAETVGAERAALFVHDRVTDTLQAVAARGVRAEALAPIAAADPASITARVYRSLHPEIAGPDEPGAAAEQPVRRGALLGVPVLWSTRGHGEPLGVMVLSGRAHGQAFTAGDLKLVSAIAAQIAAAIQNARLVRASLQQQRLQQEMLLAHDLQMKLLPSPDVAAPEARVAARVVPAESVGGDFYHLFRLGEGQTGVMIGDVSGHGYRAALIMALTMSASAIHAQTSSDPAATLAAVLRSLREELSSTDMFISCFYGVVDPWRGELRYANAGHPHAFVVGRDGAPERLPAGSPALGLVDLAPSTSVRPWRAGEDLLVLFTDGVSDATDRLGRQIGEAPVLAAVTRAATEPEGRGPAAVVERVFDALEAHAGDAPPRDDLTLVVLES